MGGLRTHIPVTYWMMIIGTLALTGFGIPFAGIGTAGFISKDMRSLKRRSSATTPPPAFAFWMLVIAAILTSFYSWRLIFMTFHGKPRASSDVMHHVHESPMGDARAAGRSGARRTVRRHDLCRRFLRLLLL